MCSPQPQICLHGFASVHRCRAGHEVVTIICRDFFSSTCSWFDSFEPAYRYFTLVCSVSSCFPSHRISPSPADGPPDPGPLPRPAPAAGVMSRCTTQRTPDPQACMRPLVHSQSYDLSALPNNPLPLLHHLPPPPWPLLPRFLQPLLSPFPSPTPIPSRGLPPLNALPEPHSRPRDQGARPVRVRPRPTRPPPRASLRRRVPGPGEILRSGRSQ